MGFRDIFQPSQVQRSPEVARGLPVRTNAIRLAPLGVTYIVFCSEERALRTPAWEGLHGGRLPPLEDCWGSSGYT